MGKRKPFDLEEARRRLEELGDGYYGDKATQREIWKLRQAIYAEEDRLAQEYYNDPESRARDEAMKQSNKEALERWKAEHPNTPCYAEPNKTD